MVSFWVRFVCCTVKDTNLGHVLVMCPIRGHDYISHCGVSFCIVAEHHEKFCWIKLRFI